MKNMSALYFKPNFKVQGAVPNEYVTKFGHLASQTMVYIQGELDKLAVIKKLKGGAKK